MSQGRNSTKTIKIKAYRLHTGTHEKSIAEKISEKDKKLTKTKREMIL